MGKRQQILIIDDNPADVYLIRAAITAANIDADLQVIKDGEQAIQFFDQTDQDALEPCPALVILHMRNSARCRAARVVAVSTSESPRDREEMMRLGADNYFHKPSEFSDFMKLGDLLRALLSGY
jgi:chemotaxis family two-component system response regulator Rcp1